MALLAAFRCAKSRALLWEGVRLDSAMPQAAPDYT